MKDRNIGLQEACDYIGVRCQEFMDDYLSARDELRATVGGDVSRFVDGIGSWMIGNMVYATSLCSLQQNSYSQLSIGGALSPPVTLAPNMMKSGAL